MNNFLAFVVVAVAIVLSLYRYPTKDPGEREPEDEIFEFPAYHKWAYDAMEKDLKVFVYPPEYGPEGCNRSMESDTQYFASEMQFYNNIIDSQFVTENPDEAVLFFIPFGCRGWQNQFTSYCKPSDETVLASFKRLINKYPYWNKTLGADHFWVTCEDVGEIRPEILTELSSLTSDSIRVFSYSNPLSRQGRPSLNVTIPEMALPFVGPTIKRNLLAYYPHFRLSNIRDEIVAGSDNDTDHKLDRKRNEYITYLNSCKFCPCPSDDSRRFAAMLADAIHFGCVPVILYDRHALPFDGTLKWGTFAVLLEVETAIDLRRTLVGIKDANYTTLRRNVMKARKHFQWNSPPVRLDAFHMTMYELWMHSLKQPQVTQLPFISEDSEI